MSSWPQELTIEQLLMHSMVTSAGGKALTTFVVVSISFLPQEHARYALPRTA